jgi:Holliday junction DNA helicase RuvA
MIGKIKGTLQEIDGNIGLIETSGGISYQVYLTSKLITHSQLPTAVEIYTYLQVREDALVLFGFETKKEYDMYSLLLSVSGVGPKTAFSVISVVSVDDLLEAIKDNNIDYFKKVPGLGTKTAMKIILELSQKLKEEFKMEKMYLSDDDKTVVDALVSLGFKSQEAKTILQKIPKNLSVEERIREGIKLATSKKESSSVKR